MKNKEKKELEKAVKQLYPSDGLELRIQEFLSLVGEHELLWVPWKNKVYFYSSHLALALGKHRTDFAANWVNKGKVFNLKGTHCNFTKSNIEDIKIIVGDRMGRARIAHTSWFIDWEMAYDYSVNSYKAFKQTGTPKYSNELDIVIDKDNLLVNSRAIAKQLNIEHDSLCSTLDKYKEKIKLFGELRETGEDQLNSVNARNTIKSYLLNEDQAYFLGTLSRNTDVAVEFKYWLVEQFSRARKIVKLTEGQEDTEDKIHRQLAYLSLYTSLNVICEFPLEVTTYENNVTKKTIKRIDLLINKAVGIELKNEKISSNHITEVIGNRGYYHALKKLPTFKYLIICSPHGLTHNAAKMLEVAYPKVIFLYPTQIGDKLGQLIMKQYPPSAHWWLKKILFPKFDKILSAEFIKLIDSDNPNYQLPPAANYNKV